jgi:hypothetical protein
MRLPDSLEILAVDVTKQDLTALAEQSQASHW